MRTLRIPGLIDLVRVSEPALIRDLADNPHLDRIAEGGPLVSRLVRGQIATALRTPGGPLPSAMRRDSAERAGLRAALTEALAAPDLDDRLGAPVAAAAAYVAGGNGHPGRLAQTLFGLIFVEGFEASRSTWAAAETLDRSLAGPSIRGILYRLTGRLAKAQRELSVAMAEDRNGVHAIGVAAHNLAASLSAMRELDPDTPAEAAVARTLSVPERVPRQGTAVAETVAARIRPGTLVLLNTRDARARTLDPRDGFLAKAWSGCPAHAFVPRLLTRIWTAAGDAR